MTRSLEAMLARWQVLYPEITGAGEQYDDPASEADRVRSEVIAPLLEAADLVHAFDEMREEYKKRRDSVTETLPNVEDVLTNEDRLDDVLTATFGVHSEELGEQAIRATMESIRLRRIVRRSVLPQREGWPEESWEKIGHLMTNSELCLAGILEYLSTEEGNRANVETLARWAFENALDAYWDAGYFGRETTREQDIPWP